VEGARQHMHSGALAPAREVPVGTPFKIDSFKLQKKIKIYEKSQNAIKYTKI
jgi:hypothetical protein